MKKKGNALTIIAVILSCLLIGLVLYYLLGNKKVVEESVPEQKQSEQNKEPEPLEEIEEPVNDINGKFMISSKYDSEKFTLQNLSNDGYAFIKVYYDDRYDIIQLTNNGEKKTIMSFKSFEDNSVWNEPFHALIQNNRLYFEITYGKDFEMGKGWNTKNSRLVEIDLDTLYSKIIYDSDKYELIYDEYAVSEPFVFTLREGISKMVYSIFKYDSASDENEVINSKLQADEVFVYDSKLFLKCFNKKYKGMNIKDNKKINTKKTYNYLSMDKDGNNMRAYTEKEYKEYKKKANIKTEGFNSDNNMYFIYNGKKIYIKDNNLMYGNNILFKASKGTKTELYYTDKDGYVAIYNYKNDNQSISKERYYLINIDTKKAESVKEKDVHDFYQIVYK